MERPKVGFNVPLNEWFRDELYPMAHDLLTDASFAASGLFEPAAAQAMLEQHRSGHQNYGGVIWSLVAFELWRRSEPVAQGAVLPTKTERPPEGPALVTAA